MNKARVSSRCRRRLSAACASMSAALFLLATPATAAEAVPGDGPRIAFWRSDLTFTEIGLWTARPDGSGQRLVMRGVGFFPDWSPDRRRLVFDFTDEAGNQQIGSVRPDGSKFRKLTQLAGISEAADYSPDGQTIIFDRSPTFPGEPGFHTSLWTMDANGGNARPLFGPGPDTFDVEPEFSPDGARITFTRLVEQPGQDPMAAVFVANADGTHIHQLTPYESVIEHPRWSPDGRHIVFNIEYRPDLDDPINGIWKVRARGGDMGQILPTTSTLHGFKPDYSPDGRQILFGCFARLERQEDLCVMDADGSNVRRITRTLLTHENFPVWD